jgi:hypothetical protein
MQKKIVIGMAAALSMTAGAAQAQICAGFPTGPSGLYFGGRVDFPQELNSVGVEAAYNPVGPIGINGGMDIVSVEDLDDSDQNVFNLNLSVEVASLSAVVGPRASVCPQVGVVFSDEEDSDMAIPIGLGIGGSLGAPGLPIDAYAIPQLVIFRTEILDETETETEFGFRAGVNVGFGGMFSIGGEVQHIFVDEADPVFGIRAGIRL